MDNKKEAKSLPGITSFDDLLALSGTKGFYNIIVFIACASVGFMTPMQVLSSGFLGSTPDYWCQVDELTAANWTAEQVRELASPSNKSCEYLNYNYSVAAKLGYETVMADLSLVPKTNGTSECQHRYFEEGVYTIVTEWDLVCDNVALYSTTFLAVQLGKLIGSPVFGYISQKFGRRRGFFLGLWCLIPTGLLTAAVSDVHLFTAFRVLSNACGSAMYISGFVLAMEICSLSQRPVVSTLFVVPWGIGYMTCGGLAYFIRDWRYLQIAATTPALLFCPAYFFIPESPRWLCQNGRHRDALKILKNFAVHNHREIPEDNDMLDALTRIEPSVWIGL